MNANERTTYRHEKSFHVSQATMDITSLNQEDYEGISQLWIRKNSQNILLATLSRSTPQWKLELAFASNERVKFYTKGSSQIFLSGYIIPAEDSDFEIKVSF